MTRSFALLSILFHLLTYVNDDGLVVKCYPTLEALSNKITKNNLVNFGTREVRSIPENIYVCLMGLKILLHPIGAYARFTPTRKHNALKPYGEYMYRGSIPREKFVHRQCCCFECVTGVRQPRTKKEVGYGSKETRYYFSGSAPNSTICADVDEPML